MGFSFPPYLIHLLLLLLLLLSTLLIPHAVGCYSSILSFGDSITDTGNLYISSHDKPLHFSFPPYGETYFHHPTGRCSDGRLIIDFIGTPSIHTIHTYIHIYISDIFSFSFKSFPSCFFSAAESLGLPPVRPYLEIKNNQTVQNFQGGVNFAVVGATALDAAFLEAMGDHNDYTNSSLTTQLDCFKEMLSSLCNNTTPNCNKVLSRSLILMGEIGGNDYNDPLFMGKSIEEVQTYVPLVIEVIASTIKELIELGATTLLIPGNLPIGCLPVYLTKYETSDKNQYDPATGCLNWLNKFAEYHNEQLQIELSQIRKLHHHVNIIYADYYNAMMDLYHCPDQFGFSRETRTKSCCGGGGPYNYNSSAKCGSPEASACDNPAQFISWDGIHSTEAAYRWIAKGLLKGNYTIPSISTLCLYDRSSNDLEL